MDQNYFLQSLKNRSNNPATVGACILVLAALACNLPTPSPNPPSDLLPTLPPIQPTPAHIPTLGSKTVLLEDEFQTEPGRWIASAQPPSNASMEFSDGGLIAEFNVALDSFALLSRHTNDLPQMIDGITLRLTAHDRPFFLLIGAEEADKSWYHIFLPLHPEDGERSIDIAFKWMILNETSQDENDLLDLDQIAVINIVDISPYMGALGQGTLRIDEVSYWQGEGNPPQTRCLSDGEVNPTFLSGADASYITQGEERNIRWYADGMQVDPIDLLAAQGVQSLRLRIWAGKEGETELGLIKKLALRALDKGMSVYPVFFLSSDWADVNKQPAPPEWQNLTLEARARVIREYTYKTAKSLLEVGIDPPYYEIGNEIDFGISGVFAELGERDIESLTATTWPEEALLLDAAINGVLQADPEASIMLHIAMSFDPHFSVAFFSKMRDLGVDYDVAGLSLYPSAFGPFAIENFCRTLDRLSAEIGTPIVIAEFAYPAETPKTGLFGGWRYSLLGYPLTPQGQAQWLADFFNDMQQRWEVIGAYYFSPTFYWSGALWGPFALFDESGGARPALGAFMQP